MSTAVLDLLESSGALSEDAKAAMPAIHGLVIVKDKHATIEEQTKLESYGIPVQEAAHPVPDERSVAASKSLLETIQQHASEKTLVLACISGGGSALFCAPRPPLSLEDLQATNTALLQSGWNIQDMNVVRKRLELGKGGRLAEAAYPSRVVSLILSDVLGDPLDLIASGPTVPDSSTWQDAWELVQRLPGTKLEVDDNHPSLPRSVMQVLQDGKNGLIEDSPTAKHAAFEKCANW